MLENARFRMIRQMRFLLIIYSTFRVVLNFQVWYIVSDSTNEQMVVSVIIVTLEQAGVSHVACSVLM